MSGTFYYWVDILGMLKLVSKNEEIERFFAALEDVRSPLFDSGLIILEPKSKNSAENIVKALPAGKAIFHALSDSYESESFARKLVIANREGEWLIVECSTDPAPTVIQILKQIAEDNRFALLNFENKEIASFELNPKTRIIMVAKNKTIEEQISYPFFFNLFGPILRI
ncbi:MAG: hypothetical protein HYT12_00345 [Candidatus Liptonbacteria bacterium]|nr:hypothetical protein [Candidatus Liptonbacteria bacterium]